MCNLAVARRSEEARGRTRVGAGISCDLCRGDPACWRKRSTALSGRAKAAPTPVLTGSLAVHASDGHMRDVMRLFPGAHELRPPVQAQRAERARLPTQLHALHFADNLRPMCAVTRAPMRRRSP